MENFPKTALFLCPTDKRYACSWTGLSDDILEHFQEEHDSLLFFSNSICIDLNAPSENVLLLTNDEIYLAQTLLKSNGNCILIRLRFLGPQYIANTFTFDINLSLENGTCLERAQFVNMSDGGFELNLNQLKQLYQDTEHINCSFDIVKKQENDIKFDTIVPVKKRTIHMGSQSMREDNHRRKMKRRNTQYEKNDAVYEDLMLLERIQESDCNLVCTNCAVTLKPPIFLCGTDHNICADCVTDLCKRCDTKVTDNHNYELEKKCTTILYQCKYFKNNCPEKDFLENLTLHECKCRYCDYKCPVEDCRETKCLSYEAMKKHLHIHHGSIPQYESLIRNFPKNSEFFLIDINKGVFYCKSVLDMELMTWSVLYCGPSDRKFFCEIKFTKYASKPLILQATENANKYSISLNLSEMKKQKFKDKHAVLIISMF